jgi:hypothetical protein
VSCPSKRRRRLRLAGRGQQRGDRCACLKKGYARVGRAGRAAGRDQRLRRASGNPGVEQTWLQPGIVYCDRRVACAYCRKDFDSSGLRCCSTDCERRYSERESNLATMAEVGSKHLRPSASASRAEVESRLGARAGRYPASPGSARRNAPARRKWPKIAKAPFLSLKRSIKARIMGAS